MSTKIGILGGGQLAKMLACSARKYELETIIYAQDISEPACALAKAVMIGPKDSEKKLTDFFNYCDFILLESEFYSADLLEKISKKSQTKIYPEIQAYKKLATKEDQARFFKSLDIDMAPRRIITSEKDLASLDFDPPYMLKLSYGGYDGYGNNRVESLESLNATIKKMSENFSNPVIVEKFLNIKAEYAGMLVKGAKNSLILPICKTYQESEICHLVSFPAEIGEKGQMIVEQSLKKIDEAIEGIGLYAFEFFETIEGDFYINEAAPRVHNSYHFSIEGFSRSQFDLFIECALGMNLNPVKLKHKYLSMVNILGQSAGEEYNLSFPYIDGDFDFKIHLYGKKQARPGRKLGHLTLFGEKKNLDFARKIHKEYRI